MRTVLVTGSNGFVGPYLVSELKHHDWNVLAPDRNELEITDSKSVQDYIFSHRPSTIFNLAAQSKPGVSFTAFEETFDINLYGTHNLLEAVRTLTDYTPRVFLVGSPEEHGRVLDTQLPITETSGFAPVNPYGLSKLASYYLSRQYGHNYGLDIVYVCPFTNLGPGQKKGFLVPDVCEQIVAIENGRQIPVLKVGSMSAKKDFTDVRDIVKGYVTLIEKGISGERYNLCSGVAVQTQTIVQTLVNMSKVHIDIEVDPAKFRPNEIPILYGSYKKMHDLTGWKPSISLETTLRDCLDFARNTGVAV